MVFETSYTPQSREVSIKDTIFSFNCNSDLLSPMGLSHCSIFEFKTRLLGKIGRVEDFAYAKRAPEFCLWREVVALTKDVVKVTKALRIFK